MWDFSEQRAKAVFTSLSWSLLILVTACFCYLNTWVKQEHTANLVNSFGWSLRDWSLWLLFMPIIFNKIEVKAMDRLELNHYLLKMLKLFLTLSSLSISLKLVFTSTGAAQILEDVVYYLPYEFKVFTLSILFAHFFKFHWQKKAIISNDDAEEQVSTFKPDALNPETSVLEAQKPHLLSVSKGNRQLLIATSEVLWVAACGNYSEIYTSSDKYLIRITMKQIEFRLGPDDFIRIHRSYIVNKNSIKTVQRINGQANITTNCGKQLPFGRTYLKKFTEIENSN